MQNCIEIQLKNLFTSSARPDSGIFQAIKISVGMEKKYRIHTIANNSSILHFCNDCGESF